MKPTRARTKKATVTPLTQSRRQRRSIIDKVYGMWKHRRPDPIKELVKMRREWQ